MSTNPPALARRSTFSEWLVYQIIFPMIQVLVGILVILIAKTRPRPVDLLEGITLSIFAVTILSGVIGSLGRSHGLVSDKAAKAAKACFWMVLISSVALVCLYYTRNVRNPDFFIAAQLGLALMAAPAAWAARV